MANISQELIQCLATSFNYSSSGDKTLREKGTSSIKEFTQNQDNILILLQLCGSEIQIDGNLKKFISIIFKNEIKENYPENDTTENLITNERKEAIKSNIISIILNSNIPGVQAQLLEAVSIISNCDFPKNAWPTLVSQLSQNLESLLATNNYQNINKILNILKTVLNRFRYEVDSDNVLRQLLEILKSLPEVFFKLIINTSDLIDKSNNAEELLLLFTSAELQMNIFFSLSYVDLPEAFEDNLVRICPIFHKYLVYRSQVQQLISGVSEDDSPILNQVQATICEILNHYTLKYDDEISNYLETFVKDVWVLLTQTSNEIKNDQLVFSAVLFLGSVSMSIKHELFNSQETLQQICSGIIIPNIKLRECDIELFEDEKVEYMARDIEGSDSDTRRRASIELVRGLRKFFETPITQLLFVDIEKLLQEYQANPKANWLSKDSAIFLVTALAVKSFDKSENKLFNVSDFYKNYIEGELANPSCHEILKADCLKFATIFRMEISGQNYPRLVQMMIPCLQNPDYIIHTYASTCIDRLLTVKESNGELRLKLSPQDLPQLLVPLANVFNFKCSKQNERTMRAIVRLVLMMIGKVDQATTVELLKKFTSIILEEAKNPTNHLFDHYCFEVIGSLLKSFSSETEIFLIVIPLIEFVLQNNVVEFSPYIFQLLAVLVETSKPENLPNFHAALDIVTQAAVWKNTANIPALVRLLQAYLKKDSATVVNRNQLTPILGIFKELVAMSSQDHEGFFLLESIVENLPFDSYKDYTRRMFDLILERIAKKKTEKVVKCFVIFLSIFIAKNSVVTTMESIKSVRPDLWEKVLDKLYLPTALTISGEIEKKILSVGLTYLVCSKEIMNSSYDIWLRILKSQYSLITGHNVTNEVSEHIDEVSYLDQSEQEGYTPSFTQLQFSKKQDVDPFPTLNPKQFFISQLQSFVSTNKEAATAIQQAGINLSQL